MTYSQELVANLKRNIATQMPDKPVGAVLIAAAEAEAAKQARNRDMAGVHNAIQDAATKAAMAHPARPAWMKEEQVRQIVGVLMLGEMR